jgi:hypothetical protein
VSLSDFIRNASPERKAEVYARVLDGVSKRQEAVLLSVARCPRCGMPQAECDFQRDFPDPPLFF